MRQQRIKITRLNFKMKIFQKCLKYLNTIYSNVYISIRQKETYWKKAIIFETKDDKRKEKSEKEVVK